MPREQLCCKGYSGDPKFRELEPDGLFAPTVERASSYRLTMATAVTRNSRLWKPRSIRTELPS